MAEYLNTRQLAEYIDINEKKIYSLITQKKLPATKITGKWLFPKNMVDKWIESNTRNMPGIIKYLKKDLLITGSNDPAFLNLLNQISFTHADFIPFVSTTGSLKGLKILNTGEAHLCCSHLLDKNKTDYNIPFINSFLKDKDVVIINFAIREQGLVFLKSNPFKISNIKDIARPKIIFINRQPGSGTRVLTDLLLNENSIYKNQINGYKNEVGTHMEVGLKILTGQADTGICIKAAANRLNLGFAPIMKESFDLIIDKEYFFLKEIQMLIDAMKTNRFKNMTENYGGYDLSNTGKIVFQS